MFLVVVTGVWGIGYAGAVLLRKWPSAIGKVNMASVIFMAFVVTAMNSPILDPFRLSAFNQANRLQANEILPEEFDYLYTRFHLGRYGNQVLDALENSGNEEIKHGVERSKAVSASDYAMFLLSNIPPESVRREIISHARVIDADGVQNSIPEEFINYFVEEWGGSASAFQNVSTPNELVFVFMNVERENQTGNLILFTPNESVVYKINKKNFAVKPEFLGFINGFFDHSGITSQDIKTVENEFFDIQIGSEIYQILK